MAFLLFGEMNDYFTAIISKIVKLLSFIMLGFEMLGAGVLILDNFISFLFNNPRRCTKYSFDTCYNVAEVNNSDFVEKLFLSVMFNFLN